MTIKGSLLPDWTLNGGSGGGNGAALNGPEYDGYLTLTSGSEKLSLPWHVLPRKSSETAVESITKLRTSSLIKLKNKGVAAGDFDLFSRTGKSPKVPRSELPQPGDNFALIDLDEIGVRHLPAAVYGADYLEFAIGTHRSRVHPNYPAEFDIYIDSNSDGTDDFVVFNAENGGFSASGQNAGLYSESRNRRWRRRCSITDADLNSRNTIYTVPMNSTAGPVNVGVQPGTTFRFSVYAFDNYFTGNLTDLIEGMRFTPGAPRYVLGDEPFGSVAPGSHTSVSVTKAIVPDVSTTESGVLLFYRRNGSLESEFVKVK